MQGNFRRFTDLEVLTGIGRNTLTRFLEPFAPDLATRKIYLPPPDLYDPAYFHRIAALFSRPDLFPPTLLEALHSVRELAEPACHHQMQANLAVMGVSLIPRRYAPLEQFGIEVWLALPALVASAGTYNLDPLRSQGKDALSVAGIAGMEEATLRGYDILWENTFFESTIIMADDIFDFETIPKGGVLSHARFDCRFTDSPEPRYVDIWPPHTLHLARTPDAPTIRCWLSHRGFTAPLSRSLLTN